MRTALIGCSAALLLACSSSPAPEPDCAHPGLVTSRAAGWRSDVRCLVATVEARHPDPFTVLPRATFEGEAAAIADAAPALSDPEVAVRLMALVARIGDGHTRVRGPAWRPLTLGLRRFPEGIYVVSAGTGAAAWLGRRVVAMGPLAIDDARARVAALVARENESSVPAREADLLGTLEVLQGIGATSPGDGAVELALEAGGQVDVVRVGALQGQQVSFPASLPSSLRRTDVPYWYAVDATRRTVYVQYNACTERQDVPMARFALELSGVLAGGAVDRAVLDLRWNGGGSSLVNLPLERVFMDWEGSRDASRFQVLVGPDTFSSALFLAVDLRTSTAARLVGELPGSNPNHFGQVAQVALPWSRLDLRLSTQRFHLTDDPRGLAPDEVVPWTWSDYARGVDPVAAAAGVPGP